MYSHQPRGHGLALGESVHPHGYTHRRLQVTNEKSRPGRFQIGTLQFAATQTIGQCFWRRRPDSNRGGGLCRPLPNHSATPPEVVSLLEAGPHFFTKKATAKNTTATAIINFTKNQTMLVTAVMSEKTTRTAMMVAAMSRNDFTSVNLAPAPAFATSGADTLRTWPMKH